MTLYHWQSRALENYSCGDIVAEGATVEEARANARAAWPAYAADRWCYLFAPGYELDPDDIAQRDEKTAQFEDDLRAEPVQLRAVLISGGE